MKLPKFITARTKDGRAVITTWQMYSKPVEVGFDDLFGTGVGTALVAALDPVFAGLKTRMDTLVEVAGRRIKEGRDLVPVRKGRDELTAELYGAAMYARDVCTPVLGEDFVLRVGLAGRIPNDANGLYDMVGHVLVTLPKVPVPELTGPVSVDVEGLFAPLRDLHAKLGANLQRLAVESKEADLALAERDKAQAEYDLVFGTAAKVLSDLLETVGEQSLADKVRPSVKRPGRTSGELPVDDVDDGGAAPAPADGEEAEG